MSRRDFWASTPRELFDEIDALVLRRQDERERDITHAWMVVNLGATTWAKGRVPELSPLLETMRPRRPQSVAEQRAVLELLATRLGKTLTTRTERDGRSIKSHERPLECTPSGNPG